MPNNKKLKLSKIKASDKAHPYSRKAVQMRRAINRQDKLVKQKSASDERKTRTVERMLWFKYALPEDISIATNELVHDIIKQYIARNEEELAEIRGKLRQGRPRPSRLDLLENLKSKDEQEYINGIEIPVLTDAKNVTILRAWEGDYNGIDRIKVVVVRRPGLSTDPIKGSSTEGVHVADGISSITGMQVDE
ncbi:hypothetical protein SpCBS45565_g00057 [Spizellomyces sp. 'palustris']|nr:hypothetical protein SpCBS45565_g00057 [Spizellomyces sp. 'palustris']